MTPWRTDLGVAIPQIYSAPGFQHIAETDRFSSACHSWLVNRRQCDFREPSQVLKAQGGLRCRGDTIGDREGPRCLRGLLVRSLEAGCIFWPDILDSLRDLRTQELFEGLIWTDSQGIENGDRMLHSK